MLHTALFPSSNPQKMRLASILATLTLHIPCSRDNPKILRRYHTEIVCDCASVFSPVSRDFVPQEFQRRFCELLAGPIGLVVRDVFVHDAPQSLDRVQMRAIGGEKMQLGAAARAGQPFLHELGVMVARV